MRTTSTAAQYPAAHLRLAQLLAWLLLSLFLAVASAQELVAVPPLQARVTDLTGTLAADRIAALDAQLRAFEERKGVQIAVLMVRSTQPEPVEQYALRVVEQWKLGRRKVDDGALLLVAKDDRAVRIEVGYGIEGALSDLVARRIIDEVITPRFRQGDFDGGIAAGAEQIMRVVDGEPLPAASPRRQERTNDIGQAWPFLFVVALMLGGLLRNALGRVPGAVVTAGVLGAAAWLVVGTLAVATLAGLAGFFVTLLGIGMGGHGGMHGRHRGGGWLGGGFGGGGGGFRGGGGGFGGGGASGRW
ncbi:TPA: TPM domain-containing protein [Pseudomonas aeruginosa]|nr:TPM domain-containing protein [Pseudomonas aeruginosa]